jgi:hypothetical protein
LFVLLTILFTFFVFWVEFQRYSGGGGVSGGGGFVSGVSGGFGSGVSGGGGGGKWRNWWYCDVK